MATITQTQTTAATESAPLKLTLAYQEEIHEEVLAVMPYLHGVHETNSLP